MPTNWAGQGARFRSDLLEDVIPFWERHSIDEEYGGYFTCLDRDGTVFDTDKFLWLQARQVWLFSMLYNRLEQRPAWLEIATHGARFLREHGMDAEGNWYFSVDRQGQPLVQPYNIFSDCFAAMAFSQYALATGEDASRALADRTYRNVLRRQVDPKGRWNKQVPGTRPLKGLAMPMILANLSIELSWQLDEHTQGQAIDHCIAEVFGPFHNDTTGLLHESVTPEGEKPDCFDGRLINPGHGIEAMWFLMDIAQRRGDTALIERATDTMLRILDFGWDQEHGGIYYFLDSQGRPPQQLEWDQKLWWVHLETMVALLMSYRLTGRETCLEQYERVSEWALARFPDQAHGEWFGYLDRRGEVLLPLKGGKWKGCFHVPRGLYLCMRECEQLADTA